MVEAPPPGLPLKKGEERFGGARRLEAIPQGEVKSPRVKLEGDGRWVVTVGGW